MLEAIGVIIGLLGVWLFMCDRRNEFAMPLLIVGYIIFGISAAIAHEHDKPELDGWYQSLRQPDQPNLSCCGLADAYWCDEISVNAGKTFCTITDDRDDAPLGRPHVPIGTIIEIPNHKLKWDQGNPTGHAVVFLSSGRAVYCFVQGGGV